MGWSFMLCPLILGMVSLDQLSVVNSGYVRCRRFVEVRSLCQVKQVRSG